MISLQVNSIQSKRYGIFVGFSNEKPILIDSLQDTLSLKLTYTTDQRGRLSVPRIKLYSQYPVGLLTCWSWLRLDFNSIVYPKPLDKPFRRMSGSGYEEEGVNVTQQGVDEYSGLRRYQKGDNLKRVDWKQYAKTQQLLTKEYHDLKGDDKELNWHSLSGYSVEERLQILCGWVIKANALNSEYSLHIPGLTISKNSDEQHYKACLTALALFQGGKS